MHCDHVLPLVDISNVCQLQVGSGVALNGADLCFGHFCTPIQVKFFHFISVRSHLENVGVVHDAKEDRVLSGRADRKSGVRWLKPFSEVIKLDL